MKGTLYIIAHMDPFDYEFDVIFQTKSSRRESMQTRHYPLKHKRDPNKYPERRNRGRKSLFIHPWHRLAQPEFILHCLSCSQFRR